MILRRRSGLWSDTGPIRAEIFGPERLEHHALSLAAAQTLVTDPTPVSSLRVRLEENGTALLAAYRAAARALDTGHSITPAAEWLLDNFHIVEAQLRQIRDDLPPGYYRHLPKLAEGFLAGYPRVLGLTWAYVAHTDSLLSGPLLLRFVQAYQTVQALTIGEIWAVAITLRIVLLENMRRLADQISEGLAQRLAADALVDQVLSDEVAAHAVLARLAEAGLSDLMAAQIAKRLRGMDPAETPLAVWLDHQLTAKGLTVETVVTLAHNRQGASNVTMRNIVTSMRRMAEIDWADFFEAASLIEARLCQEPGYAAMDFATRNDYRTAIEALARRSRQDEMAVTEVALAMAAKADPPLDPGQMLIGRERTALERHLGLRPARRNSVMVYLAAIVVASTLFMAAALWAAGQSGVAYALTAGFVAVEAGLALVHLIVTRPVRPKRLPFVGDRCRRYGLDRSGRGCDPAGTDACHRATHAPPSRPSVQLARHAGPARAATGLCLDRGQRLDLLDRRHRGHAPQPSGRAGPAQAGSGRGLPGPATGAGDGFRLSDAAGKAPAVDRLSGRYQHAGCQLLRPFRL